MSRKLIVRLKGGLGNQLFAYATARRLAIFNEVELVIDAQTGFEFDYKYKRSFALGDFNIASRLAEPAELLEPFGRWRRFLARKMSEHKPLGSRTYIRQSGVEFDPRILSLKLENSTTYFDAFGQSERYFFDIRDKLQIELSLSFSKNLNCLEILKLIRSTDAVAVHLRWFDSGKPKNTVNIPVGYYSEAISRMLQKSPGAHFFIFSDRPDMAAKVCGAFLGKNPFTIVAHNRNSFSAEIDFWLMRQCRHFIISNSTFAWWAAWLSEMNYSECLVIAPSITTSAADNVTAWGFQGLLPERWVLI